jgi:hypothetical protein
MPDGSDLGNAYYTDASPSLLARQPVAPPRIHDRSPEWWNTAFPHLEARLSSLRSWRWSWWWGWLDLAAYFRPDRARAFIVANQQARGRPLNDQIIDSTGLLAVNICAAGIWNGLLAPSRQWFGMGVEEAFGEPGPEETEWLQHATQMIYTMFSRSNFYTAAAQVCQDVVVFGTSPMIMYEDKQDGIRCYVPCAGEYFLGASSRLSNDTLYREYTYTVAQIVGFFGWKNCPAQVQQIWRQGGAGLDQEFVVVHCIEPNIAIADTRSSNSPGVYIVPSHFAWREVFWLKGNKTNYPLSRRGFNEQPFFTARWRVTANDPYGRGPAMDCIGDNKQFQQETLRKNEFIEKLVRPPMVAPPELKNEPASIMPGMITYSNALNGKPMFTPAFEVNAQALMPMTADIEKISGRIRDALFVTTFMAITQMAGVQPRNELELTKRDLERLQVLGPFIELFENEFAGPAIERALSIGERRGMIRPRPASLRRVPIKIKYDSIMRLAQRAAESVNLKDFATTMGVASAAAKTANAPPPARKVNWDKWATRYGHVNGLDATLFYTDDEVKEHDQARLDEAKQQQQDAMAPKMGKVAVDAAKVLTNAPTPNGSALDALIGPNAYPGAGG